MALKAPMNSASKVCFISVNFEAIYELLYF